MINMKITKLRFLKFFLLLLLFVVLSNRALYGTFNIFAYPTKLTFDSFSFPSYENTITLTGENKPKYYISDPLHKLTGKKIYSDTLDFKGPARTIYLKIGEDEYLIFSTGGENNDPK